MSASRFALLLGALIAALSLASCSGAESDESFEEVLEGANTDGGSADAEPESHGTPQLTIALEGDGMGRVTSSPEGIDCGATCSATFELDTTITLVTTPQDDSVFAGWGGACAGDGGSCDVDFDGHTAVSARFLLKRHPVSLHYGGDGTGEVLLEVLEGPACAGEPCAYAVGSRLRLSALPSDDSQFSGWNGVPCGVEPVCELEITGEFSVEALFAKQERGLAVVLAGEGKGRVHSEPLGLDCPDTCAANWKLGSALTLSAEADEASSRFVGWSGGLCSGESSTCQFTLSETSEVQAEFALLRRTLEVEIDGNGQGQVSARIVSDAEEEPGEEPAEIIRCGLDETDCEASLDHGTKVELTLTEKAGNGTGTVAGGPINCGNLCAAQLNYGTTVTLTAVADASSTFSGWSGACTGVGTCTVSMTQARNVTATFTRRTPSLTVSRVGTGGGTVSSRPAGINCGSTCSSNFDYGTRVTLIASPDATSTFSGWSGPCSGSGVCEVDVTEAVNVSATFTRIRYTLSVSRTGNGSGTVTGTGISCGSDCSESLITGTTVTLTATASASSTFTGWSGPVRGRAPLAPSR